MKFGSKNSDLGYKKKQMPTKYLQPQTQNNTQKTQAEYNEFIIEDHHKIGFGKHRGKPHSFLLEPGQESYCNWILGLEDFAVPTQRYLNERL